MKRVSTCIILVAAEIKVDVVLELLVPRVG